MIGIAGSNVGVGCTHFSIMLANYLTGYLRRKAILLEFNESGDFERLEQVCTGQTGRKNPYRILDADYYKHAGPENIKEVLLEGYDDILIDFGSVKDGEHESYWIRLKNSPHSSVTEKASAENGIRSALIRYLLENSLLVSSLPNTARLCQLFFCFALFSISNSRKLSCCHSVKEPTRNFLSHLQYDSCSPSLTDPKSIRISSYPSNNTSFIFSGPACL